MHRIEKFADDVCDVRAENLDARRRERFRRERADPRVLGRIEIEHLADRDLGDGSEGLHPERGQLLGLGCAVG